MLYSRNPADKPRRYVSSFDSLSTEQRKQLIGWLTVENAPYRIVLERLREHFGVTSSNTALSGFYHRECAPLLAKQSGIQIKVEVTYGGRTVDRQIIHLKDK